MRRKTRNKSKAYWKHGKHKGMQEIADARNQAKDIKRKRREQARQDMKESIRDLFDNC